MNKNRQRITNTLKTAGYSFYTERNAVWFIDNRTQSRYKSIFAVDHFLKMKKDELQTLCEFLKGAFNINKDRKPTKRIKCRILNEYSKCKRTQKI